MTEADPAPDPHARPTPEELERAILRDQPVYDAVGVAEAAGVDPGQAHRLWKALGFPQYADEVAFTHADAAALNKVVDVVESGAIDFDTAINLTRALGQTMSRLADWEVGTLVSRIEELEAGEGATGSRMGSAMRLVDRVNGPFEDLMIYAWRRHLAAAAARVETLGANEEDLHSVALTVGFADIVGFTALSNELDEDQIGDLVEVFESRCADVVATHRGRVIKTIGDSVLFVNDSPVRAVDTAESIIEAVGRDPRMPDVRLGLATGSVVTRMGDVFGRPVNLAARLTAVARRNRVIIDQATADLLPVEEFLTRVLPARPVRGLGVIEPLKVRRLV